MYKEETFRNNNDSDSKENSPNFSQNSKSPKRRIKAVLPKANFNYENLVMENLKIKDLFKESNDELNAKNDFNSSSFFSLKRIESPSN
jgi:hypothetical protein